MGSSASSTRRVDLDPEIEVLDDEICREEVESLCGIFVGCKNNHENFIQADSFVLEDLPEEIRHQAVLNMVFHNGNLVVKVQRLNSKFSKPHSGSGSVCYFSDTHDLFACNHGNELNNCSFCHIPDCPYTKKFGEDHYLITNFVPTLTEEQLERAHIGFRVSTNHHVVASCREAAMTKVELFFDTPETGGQRNPERITAQGVCLCAQWDEQDKVHMVCVADRSEKLQKLLSTMREVFWEHFNAIPEEIKEKLCKDYVIMVSHPHGTSKRISIGRNQGCREVVVNSKTRYVETRYDADSCQGSSGGVVLGPGWVDGGPAYRVHCGTDRITKEKVSKSFWVTKGVGKTEVHKDNKDNYSHASNQSFLHKLKALVQREKRCCPTQCHKALPEKV